MEEATPFLYGVLIYNFSVPILIPVLLLFRLRYTITKKFFYLFTAIPACYLGGLVVVTIIYSLEKRFGIYDGNGAPSLIGFLGQNILSLFVYIFVAWVVSRFFRKRKIENIR